MLLACQHFQGCQITLLPPFPQCDSVPSPPGETSGTSQGIACIQGLGRRIIESLQLEETIKIIEPNH